MIVAVREEVECVASADDDGVLNEFGAASFRASVGALSISIASAGDGSAIY